MRRRLLGYRRPIHASHTLSPLYRRRPILRPHYIADLYRRRPIHCTHCTALKFVTYDSGQPTVFEAVARHPNTEYPNHLQGLENIYGTYQALFTDQDGTVHGPGPSTVHRRTRTVRTEHCSPTDQWLSGCSTHFVSFEKQTILTEYGTQILYV